MKIFLSGKIRNAPHYGTPLFSKYTRLLRAEGHHVFNPIEETRKIYGADVYDSSENFARIVGKVVFARDMSWLINEAEAICMLPLWNHSDGATAECATAKALGKKIYYLDYDFLPPELLKTTPTAAPMFLQGYGPRAYTISQPGINVAAETPAEVERRSKIEALQKKIHSEIVSAPGPLSRRTFSVMQEIVDLL